MSAWVRGNLLWKGRIFKKKSEIPQNDLTKPNIEGHRYKSHHNVIGYGVAGIKLKKHSAPCPLPRSRDFEGDFVVNATLNAVQLLIMRTRSSKKTFYEHIPLHQNSMLFLLWWQRDKQITKNSVIQIIHGRPDSLPQERLPNIW